MDDDNNFSEERVAKLGFLPQRELIYNRFLPYADQLDDESTKLFTDIKTNLVKAVLAREMLPGVALWTSRLNKYIQIYGMKFSKEDHISLIKLYYELIIIPDLKPTRITKCANMLVLLLNKKYLLTRDELQLEWRPLYEICVRVVEKSKNELGMYHYHPSFESTIYSMVKTARVYFPAAATQEILDEFRPRLCPFNTADITSAVQYLECFLPVDVKPEEADISYKLWFDEFMTLWNVCHNSNSWENHMMCLMMRLARFQEGYIDWEPHVPMMFVRIMRNFQLPVNLKQKQLGKMHKIDISHMSAWIIYALDGDKNSVFYHLEKLLQTLESYFHPANAGRWTNKLRELLLKLSFYMVQRVHVERYQKKSWNNCIPEHVKLTDEDIDRFVNLMKPCIEHAIFTRTGAQDVTMTLKYLASLRPNIIVPLTLEKLYSSMDSLTEPHRLTSSIMSVFSVGRYMLNGDNYPEGPTHLIPLLIALLPGIDPNDIRKTYVTLNFIVIFVNMVPLIDSSSACHYHELTEEEHITCEATAGFEDFVLQLFDRLTIWLESSAVDFVRLEQITNTTNNCRNRMDAVSERALASLVGVVLSQSSPAIFRRALDKMYDYVRSNVLEVQTAGKMLGAILGSFAKINPQDTANFFIPFLCDMIEKLIEETPNVETEEHVDAQLLYYLLLLSEVVNVRAEILKHLPKVTKILNKTLYVTCKSTCLFAAYVLENIVKTLSFVIPTDIRSCQEDYSASVKDFLSVRFWGKPQNVDELKVNWFVPGEKEAEGIRKLVVQYLEPELEKLNKYSLGEKTLTRHELQQSLGIVVSMLAGQAMYPMWTEQPISLVESVLDPWTFNLKVGVDQEVHLPQNKNIRKTVVDTLHLVQKKMLEIDEGDTKSIKLIILIYNTLLFNKPRNQDFERHWKSFHVAKKMLEDHLQKGKLHLRHILIERVSLEEEFRNECRICSFTETHKQILLDLFELSTCRYSEVRIAAQSKLFAVIQYFPYSYTILTSKITDILQSDTQLNHEQFKGCLNILIGPKASPIITRHDWEFIRTLWPLIVRSMPSEKPSIISLMDCIVEAVHKHFPTIVIKLEIPEKCLEAARRLSEAKPALSNLSWNDKIEQGQSILQNKSLKKVAAYEGLVTALLDACQTGKLHWRYHSMALNFLRDLVHVDISYNAQVVRFFLHATINESIIIRKLALRVCVFIFIQNKPKYKKTILDPFSFSKETHEKKLYPGVRPDNEWLLYKRETVPRNEEAWNEKRFYHDQFSGHYAWPKELKTYSPPNEQPRLVTQLDTLSDTQNEIYKFFKDPENVGVLIKYLSMEEKGLDQFNAYRFLIFKNLFKMFEDNLLDIILPHVEKLVSEKQEASQRCAAEIVSALISGCKHWPFNKVQNLRQKIIPILNTVISNIYVETLTNWTLCMSMCLESRDPNRYFWLLEYLLDDPLKEQTSITACSRLNLLFIALKQQSWRNAELSCRLLEYLKGHLHHPFQNIRENISSCLALIFSKDLVFPNGSSNRGPDTKQFFQEILPELEYLYQDALSRVNDGQKDDFEKTTLGLEKIVLGGDARKDNALRLYKIVVKYITSSIVMSNYTTIPEFFKLLPLACVLQSNEVDEEVANISVNFLVCLCQTVTIDANLPIAIEAIKNVASCSFWSARKVISECISVFVISNMATILHNKLYTQQIQDIVLLLLEDPQPEVRVSAGQVLSGLLHCQFIPEPSKLLEVLKAKARTSLKRKTTTDQTGIIRIRHAGVLGLCSFISSHPYDVPDYLPSIFLALTPHLSDPQPIPTTIRKTLGDFKRTHHDNWGLHKLKFTQDELICLSDLTVPPSYYA